MEPSSRRVRLVGPAPRHDRLDGTVSPNSTGAGLPAASLLDGWTARSWTNGCQLDELTDLQVLTVCTMNNAYELTVLSAARGEVLVRGGDFFPDRRPARLAGATLGGSFLKLRGIYVGFRMEMHADRQAVITSPVRSISIRDADRGSRH